MDLTYHLKILPVIVTMQVIYNDWISDGTLITMEMMGRQVHAIGNAIRPPFADSVTFYELYISTAIV